MKSIVFSVLLGLSLPAMGCKINVGGTARADGGVGKHSKKRASIRIPGVNIRSGSGGAMVSLRDGDDVVELEAGARGARLSVQSGPDKVTLKADKLDTDIQVDEKQDTVTVKTLVKGARMSVESGEDKVHLKADDLNATVKVKPGARPKK